MLPVFLLFFTCIDDKNLDICRYRPTATTGFILKTHISISKILEQKLFCLFFNSVFTLHTTKFIDSSYSWDAIPFFKEIFE